jgi:uncharacterized membrane protein
VHDKAAFEKRLKRFRALPKPVRVVYARPRTFVALGLGLVALLLLPDSLRLVTRLLIGWDVFIAIYLLLVVMMTLRNDVGTIRRNAALQDDGRFLILFVTAFGAFASIAAIVSELGASHKGAQELILATLTVALTWAAVHTTFALHYAHDYYRDDGSPGGMQFPADDNDKRDDPDYWDFAYFSFVIGMTAQTSDVGITDRTIRRTATAHGVIAFIFNTALVALMVNIAASAI